MKFVKEEEDKTDDYIFQKDQKTKSVSSFTLIVLIILILGVVASGFYFKWF
ncbi:hypothetical protein [Aegicerativicinus sediminis]|uniref:hypothetical protein n=1 Tax=Aegicerativicinus sediminis TaxID=2893202 RepID=UPI001E5FA720|nr:hypothetical protein [Aegicerativicinus sediminis]